MNALEILYREYPGDSAWGSFVNALDGSNEIREKKELVYISEGITDDIAIVLNYFFGENSSVWIVSNIPALSGKTPMDVLKDHENGPIILRSLLMRMPI